MKGTQVFLERYVFPIAATATFTLCVMNPMGLNLLQQIGLGVVLTGLVLLLAGTVYGQKKDPAAAPTQAQPASDAGTSAKGGAGAVLHGGETGPGMVSRGGGGHPGLDATGGPGEGTGVEATGGPGGAGLVSIGGADGSPGTVARGGGPATPDAGPPKKKK